MSRVQTLSILAVFVLISLACNLPAAVGASVEMQPVHLTASGMKTDTSYGGNGGTCYTQQSITLDIKSDGTAMLSTTGPNFVDHINCTITPDFNESWDIDGSADPDTKVVTFTSCNQGGFRGEGQISYGGDKLSGKVTCFWLKGDDAGKAAVIFTVEQK
jgi:hypothetical protein